MKNRLNTPASGHVTLVGAGPGDPELLTLKALKAIQAATVLLVDDLVSDDIVFTQGAYESFVAFATKKENTAVASDKKEEVSA